MSYYTSYSLSVQGMKSEEDYNNVLNWLKEHEIINYALYEDSYNPYYNTQFYSSNEPVNWFHHDDDMIALSKEFPNFVFKLYGDGELSDDIWNCYYHNGEYELCEATITIEPPKKIKWE